MTTYQHICGTELWDAQTNAKLAQDAELACRHWSTASERGLPDQDEPLMGIVVIRGALGKELQLAIAQIGRPHTACAPTGTFSSSSLANQRRQTCR